MEVLGTCNCDAAGGEHLYSRLDIFDPVRGSRMELRFITDKRAHTHKCTVKYFTLKAFSTSKNKYKYSFGGCFT